MEKLAEKYGSMIQNKKDSKPLTIVIDIRPLMGGKISGIETYIHHLLKHLFQLDRKNTYILFANASKKQHITLPNFQQKNVIILQTRIPNKLLNLSLSLFRRPKLDHLILQQLRKSLMEQGCDDQSKKNMLSLPDLKTVDLFFMPDLRLSALSKNVRKITVVHDLSFHHFPQYFSRKTRLWYALLQPKREIFSSDKIVAVSNFTKKDMEQTYDVPVSKISVIHEGVEDDFYKHFPIDKISVIKQKYNLPEKYFLFLSTLEPRKNMRRLIEAFILFKLKNPDSEFKLVIAGTKNEKIFSTVAIVQHPDIVLTGFIAEEDKAIIFREAHAFLYPSLFEGFGLPLLEAMKCQTPIITSKTSAMPEIAGDAALFIDPKNVEEMAISLERIQQPVLRQQLKTAMERQIKNFSWERCAEETLAIFESQPSKY